MGPYWNQVYTRAQNEPANLNGFDSANPERKEPSNLEVSSLAHGWDGYVMRSANDKTGFDCAVFEP